MLWLLLQKYGIVPVANIDHWLFLFALDRWLQESAEDYAAEQEQQYIDDCRIDYGGI